MWAGDAVLGDTPVVLEVAQGTLRLRPENPVDLSGVEAQVVELPLQVGHVLASGHRPAVVEESVAEDITRFVERPPGVGADYAVGIEASGPLEVTHGVHRRLGVTGLWVGVRRESESAKSRSDVAYCVASVTESIEPHRRIVTGSRRLGYAMIRRGTRRAR